MYIILILGMITTFIIVFNHVENPYAIKFVIIYVILLSLFFLYFIVITIFNMRRLKWTDIQKRLFKFLCIFGTTWLVCIIFTYLMKGQVNILDKLFVPLGAAFGATFSDFLHLPGKKIS